MTELEITNWQGQLIKCTGTEASELLPGGQFSHFGTGDAESWCPGAGLRRMGFGAPIRDIDPALAGAPVTVIPVARLPETSWLITIQHIKETNYDNDYQFETAADRTTETRCHLRRLRPKGITASSR